MSDNDKRKKTEFKLINGGKNNTTEDQPPPTDPSDPGPQDEDIEEQEPDDREEYTCFPDKLGEIVEKTVGLLPQIDGIYSRAGDLIKIIRRTDSNPTKAHRICVEELSSRLTGVCRYQRIKTISKQSYIVPCSPPRDAMLAVHKRGEWPGVPEVISIQTTPPIRQNGSVRWQTGYDTETKVYYDAFEDDPVSSELSQDKAQDALIEIRKLTEDFPWMSQTDQDAWVVGLLSPLVRVWTGPSPMLVITSTVRSSGKTLLADLISIILGCSPGHMAWTKDNEEFGKRLIAMGLAGYPIITLDNCPTGWSIGNASLDMALTSDRIVGRVLKESRVVDIPMRACWFATGNNLSLSEDTARRSIMCRLSPNVERPEERDDYLIKDIRLFTRRNRPDYLKYAITIVASYLRVGCPSPPKPLGSFEEWSRVVRGSLIWAGGEDPVSLLGSFIETTDGDADIHRSLLRVWFDNQERDGMTSSTALWKTTGSTFVGELKALFDEMGIDSGNKLTRRLVKYEGRPREINGITMAIRRSGKDSSGAWLWKVEPLE